MAVMHVIKSRDIYTRDNSLVRVALNVLKIFFSNKSAIV